MHVAYINRHTFIHINLKKKNKTLLLRRELKTQGRAVAAGRKMQIRD